MKHIIILASAAALMSAPCIARTEVPDSVGDTSTDLDAVVVTARKKTIKSDGSKLTYSVKEDDTAKGQTLLEALRKVPMVTVDAEDNIRINGSQSFKIYVNGREDAMLEANYKQIFKAMPAASVQNIEVITEPGAQYDAEGTGGILNIVTESTSSRRDGYSGSLSAGTGIRDAYINGNINGKVNKFHVNASVTAADNGPTKQKSNNSTSTTYYGREDDHRLASDMKQRVGYDAQMANISMSWEPDKRNLLTWGGSVNNVVGRFNVDGTNSMTDSHGNLRWQFLNNISGKMKNLGTTANASYRLAFNDAATHRLVLGYLFNYGRNSFDYDTESHDDVNYPLLQHWQTTQMNNYVREHTVQADYSNPFGSGNHTLDLGFKGIFRHNTGATANGTGAIQDDMVFAPRSLTHQNENVYAGYVSYNGTFIDRISLTAGLRYEHTRRQLAFRLTPGDDFTTRLNDWVPNAALTYIFAPANNLRLAYQRRISRPSLNQVNPAKMVINDFLCQQGNPELDSERSDIVSLTYTNFGRILGGNVSLQYNGVENAIVNYQRVDGLQMVETYGNIGSRRMVTLQGYLNWNITNTMTVGISGNVSYSRLRSHFDGSGNSGWSGGYNVNWNWRGPAGLKFSAYGGQNLHEITFQGYYTGWYYYGLGLSRSFLKDDALMLSLNASNFLQKNQGSYSHTYAADFETRSHWSMNSANVSLSITWNFGHLKEQVKSTGLDITNDDTSTTKGKGGIGM